MDASGIDCGTCWQFDPTHFAPTCNVLLVRTTAEGFPAWVTSLPQGEVQSCGWASRKSWTTLERAWDGQTREP
ncbi:MAG: hypothetical protein WBN80_08665 [Prochlorococcaceae cyanobacterium]